MSERNSDARAAPSGGAALEEVAAATRQALIEIRDDIRSLRGEVREGIYDLRRELRGEIRDSRIGMDRRCDRLDGEMARSFRRLLSVILVGFAGMLAVMARGFHWI